MEFWPEQRLAASDESSTCWNLAIQKTWTTRDVFLLTYPTTFHKRLEVQKTFAHAGPFVFVLRFASLTCLSVCCCSPSPRGWSRLVPWSSFLLVPPSRYLVAVVTAWLPCFSARSVVVLCHPSVKCLMATKAHQPCVGFSPSTPCCR